MAGAQPSSRQRVLVSYSAAPPILSSAKWGQVQAALTALLPLRNIHWKSASRTSIRTIQELDVDLVPLDTLRDEHTQIPVTVLDKPLLNIYIVVCQNTDVEGYRTTVKKQIKDWHSAVTARKNQEWLIVHIIRPDTRAPTGNFFQLKGSVFEKIRADFNAEKRERCVQVAWSPETDAPAVWAELINKMKDGILSAFDSAIVQREEEVKRSESQRQMPGWNFCTFFILKESLASSFEGVNLFEDAYTQYEELEDTFYHVLKEKNLSWFGTLISPANGDDSAPLLSVAKKAYRDLILANSISVFDFRIYLLARQCELLAQRGRINEISRKAAAFLGAFGRRLRDIQDTLPPFFIESWIYSSALSVVEYCDNWASSFSIEGAKLKSFNAAEGELLELARTQLDVIGVTVGHLPQRPPFSSSFKPSDAPLQTTSKNTISNADIQKATENAETFYNLYVDATNRAIDMYTKAGRKKFALRLHGSLAALDLHRGNYKTALAIYTSLPAHYAPHMWTSLESFMLSKALDTHADLQREKDTEWIHILLSFLKSYIDSQGSELLMHEEDKVEYITKLVDNLRQTASELESDLAHPDHPAISLSVSADARIAETKDGCFVDVTVKNHLPCVLPADEISVVLAGRDAERCKFSSPTTGLPSGKTQLTLFCPAAAAGTYVLDSSELRISRLCFQWTHRKPPSKAASLRKETPVLVRVPRDVLALDVQLGQPTKVELGESPTLLVALSTGRNHVLEASIRLISSGVTFGIQDAYLSGDNKKPSRPLEIVDGRVVLRDIPEDTAVSFLVPHSDTSAFQAMKIVTEVEYTTVPEPSLSRTIRMTRVVLTALPVAVNVEDFFRRSRLFSKFTISTTSHQHVRICAAHLTTQGGGLEGVSIVRCATKKRGVVTVTPAQPVNFLFHIDSVHGPVRESLNLLIRYRMLREEVEAVVEEAVTQVLAASPSPHKHRVTLVNKLVEALEHDAAWVDLYGITGELKVPETSKDEADEETCRLLDEVKQLLQQHRHPYPPTGNWREIVIPVDVPYMDIIAAACVRILATPFSDFLPDQAALPLYAGQPISARLTINTSFHWGSSAGNKERRYMLRYDVEEMVRDWLVSGPKRGDFLATDNSTHSVPITLIALHHGELALPRITVTALPMAGEMTMGSMAIPSIETYQVHGAETVADVLWGIMVIGISLSSN
ncbi:putative trafficking protein particle complex subunit 10, TRAPPC10 [Lyophyllum shimeji]|uniref:Trafficking protein particle complex subunit 10, TRAPPC10 n=1 Tax=Lyophyllum shimeji TaxID=47721 RepID=A0A9P3UJG6_LYOSH|nr:putative trafficking protein particle complex subunit 10, TRAPPC10 [Lyophyllum shimeji]